MGSGVSKYVIGTSKRSNSGRQESSRSIPRPLMTNEAHVGEVPKRTCSGETSAVISALPKALEVTPRRESNMMSSIAYTPTGDAESAYPFYCPLCMEHFADILFTPKCCSNHICVRCLKDYCTTQGLDLVEGYSVNDVLFVLHQAGVNAQQSISCPQCMVSPYLPEKVAMSESRVPYSIKNYRDENKGAPLPPSTALDPNEDDPTTFSEGIAFSADDVQNMSGGKKSTPERVSVHEEGNTLDMEEEYSPIRVGDSFEDLKRKMKKFSYNGPKKIVPDFDTPAKHVVHIENNEESVASSESDGPMSPSPFDIRGCSPVRTYVHSFIQEGLARGIAAQ